MSVILQSTGGGSVTIQEPATASNFTATLPAASGVCMVSGNQPAFSAYLSSNQTVTTSTFVKVLLDAENFDTNNNFASSRFTPTVAGYYQISAGLRVPAPESPFCIIYKNGSPWARGNYTNTGTYNSVASCLVYCNGSTDYIELYGYTNLVTFSGIQSETWMSGVLVRTA